jgi:stress-induced morphogen
MSRGTKPRWHAMRTRETREVERVLQREFPKSDAYRYNSASIRVRVVDPRFKGKSTAKRDAMVERLIRELPEETQAEIMTLLTLTPEEVSDSFNRKSLMNLEFEDPSPSTL